MQYLLSISGPADAPKPPIEFFDQMVKATYELNDAMREAGAFVFAGGLHPVATATTVSINDGNAHISDGPLVDSKEQLGGFWIIDVPDLDAAIKWAEQCCEACFGPIEVRPFHDSPETYEDYLNSNFRQSATSN